MKIQIFLYCQTIKTDKEISIEHVTVASLINVNKLSNELYNELKDKYKVLQEIIQIQNTSIAILYKSTKTKQWK